MDDQGLERDQRTPRATRLGYIALILALLFFSGLFVSSEGWWSALDFNTLNGKFGTMQDAARAHFVGQGGSGARDGFLFGFSLIPGVMLALGVMEVVEYYGGLKAAHRLLTPVMRPLLGAPGAAGLALISGLQSMDAGAGMTRGLYEEKIINGRERLIFTAFQFSGGGTITNYLSSGAALFSYITVPIIAPLLLIFVLKLVGANVIRLYVRTLRDEEV